MATLHPPQVPGCHFRPRRSNHRDAFRWSGREHVSGTRAAGNPLKAVWTIVIGNAPPVAAFDRFRPACGQGRSLDAVRDSGSISRAIGDCFASNRTCSSCVAAPSRACQIRSRIRSRPAEAACQRIEEGGRPVHRAGEPPGTSVPRDHHSASKARLSVAAAAILGCLQCESG